MDEYFVWRRGDGYVDSSTYEPKYAPMAGEIDRFEILGKFDNWIEAKALIEKARKAPSFQRYLHREFRGRDLT